MEPFEWLLLGVGVAIGSLFGTQGKGLLRSAAKGYLVVEEKTKEWSANMREDFRDAVEEARYEHEQGTVGRNDAEYQTMLEEDGRRRGRGGAQTTKSNTTRARGGQTGPRGGQTGT